jgi:hypothetical protein
MRQSNERGFLDAHLEQSFKNVPNDHPNKECPKLPAEKERPQVPPLASNGSADVLATTASGSHLRQGDVKRKGADLLVAPLKLNVRLSKCGPRSVEPLRRLVKRRN